MIKKIIKKGGNVEAAKHDVVKRAVNTFDNAMNKRGFAIGRGALNAVEKYIESKTSVTTEIKVNVSMAELDRVIKRRR